MYSRDIYRDFGPWAGGQWFSKFSSHSPVSTLSFHHPLFHWLLRPQPETLHILFVNSCMKRVEIFSEMWSNKYFFSLFSFFLPQKKKYVVDSIDYTEAEKRENEWFSCHLLQFATFLVLHLIRPSRCNKTLRTFRHTQKNSTSQLALLICHFKLRELCVLRCCIWYSLLYFLLLHQLTKK